MGVETHWRDRERDIVRIYYTLAALATPSKEWARDRNQSDMGGSIYEYGQGKGCVRNSGNVLLVAMVPAEHQSLRIVHNFGLDLRTKVHGLGRGKCWHDTQLRWLLQRTWPHSVSQNGTCGGAPGSEVNGSWHLEQPTNSQKSSSDWDIGGVSTGASDRQ